MKRCDLCGHYGKRMDPINNRWVNRVDGWRCHHRPGCDYRRATLGQWTGTRVLRRRDANGTEWTIRPSVKSTLTPHRAPYTLTMVYRDHRMASGHDSPEAAKAHVEDLLASWRANSLRDYARSQQ